MPAAAKAAWGAWIPANHPQLRWEGRVRFDADRNAVFDWASVRLHLAVEGEALAVSATLGANYLDVLVDGKRVAVLGQPSALPKLAWQGLGRGPQPSADGEVYVVDGLGPGRHQVLLAKRSSANWGPVTLHGIRLAQGARLLDADPAPGRRLEFIGDSLTNGYGDEGPGKECQGLAPYENSSLGWARVCADALGADLQILALSGFGLIRNWAGPPQRSPDPLPVYYARTVQAQASPRWDRSRFAPDASVVFLGNNDFSQGSDVDGAEFESAYHRFLVEVRQDRPGLPIFCAYKDDSTPLARHVQSVVQAEQAQGHPVQALPLDPPADAELGCDWHPLAVVQARWALSAQSALRKTLHWQ